MELGQFFFLILPMGTIITTLVAIVFYLERGSEQSNYEKEMKELRKLWFMGKINRETFLYMRQNMKAEDLFGDESKRIDDMLKNQELDPDAYIRIKMFSK
jgi:hypothetical protein